VNHSFVDYKAKITIHTFSVRYFITLQAETVYALYPYIIGIVLLKGQMYKVHK